MAAHLREKCARDGTGAVPEASVEDLGVEMRMVRIALVLATTCALAAPQVAGANDRGLCGRDDRIEAGNRYLAALVTHDSSDVPLHPDAQRHENGSDTGDGAEEIRAGLESPIMYVITGIRDLRWYVGNRDAVSVYLLDTVTSPTYIVERFRVVPYRGECVISEIQAHFYIDVPGYLDGPESVAQRPEGQVERFTESDHGPTGPLASSHGAGDAAARPDACPGKGCVLVAVDELLDAMAAQDGSQVPLAADVAQTVNRRTVATSDEEVRERLSSEKGIGGVRDRRVTVDGGEATALYELDLDERTYHGGLRIAVDETGAITEIEEFCDGDELCVG